MIFLFYITLSLMSDKRTKSETVKVTLSDNWAVYELKKHSSIIQMKSVATMLQRKLFNSLLWIANEELKKDSGARAFQTTIGQLKSLIWYDDNNKYLKQLLKQMQGTNVEYNILGKDKQEVWGSFNILSWVQTENINNPNLWIIRFEFPHIVLSNISNPRLYAKLDLFLMKSLESKHTIALYELLKDYQNLGKLLISIEWFRKIMAIKDSQYTSITMMKRKVLDVAVSEINQKTDLIVDYTIVKESRAISWINFVIWIRKQAKNIAVKERELTETQQDLAKRLMMFWVPEQKANEIVAHYESDYVIWNIEVVDKKVKGWKVKNVTAYMLQAISEDFRVKETEYDKQRKQQSEEKKAKELKEKQEQERRKNEEKEFYASLYTKIDELISAKSADEVESLQRKFAEKNATNPFMKYVQEWNMSHRLVKWTRYKFLAEQRLAEHERDFEMHKKHWGGLFNDNLFNDN